METWKKSGCALCAQNCGLEMLIDNNRITKVRGDKSNPRSKVKRHYTGAGVGGA